MLFDRVTCPVCNETEMLTPPVDSADTARLGDIVERHGLACAKTQTAVPEVTPEQNKLRIVIAHTLLQEFDLALEWDGLEWQASGKFLNFTRSITGSNPCEATAKLLIEFHGLKAEREKQLAALGVPELA